MTPEGMPKRVTQKEQQEKNLTPYKADLAKEKRGIGKKKKGELPGKKIQRMLSERNANKLPAQ